MANDLLMGRSSLDLTPVLDAHHGSYPNEHRDQLSDQWYTATSGSGSFHLTLIGKDFLGTIIHVRKKDTRRIYAANTASRPGEATHIHTERTVLALIDNPFIVPLKFSFQNSHKLYLVIQLNGGELLEYHTGHIALCDFGLCKLNMSQTDRTNSASAGEFEVCLSDNRDAAFCGTPEYMTSELLPYTMTVYDDNVNVMYQRILSDPLQFPAHTSEEARSARCCSETRRGADAKKIQPPFEPSALDVADFDQESTLETAQDSVVQGPQFSETVEDQPRGFT
ncbi:hypothetical protein F5148DRAFT_1276849 [Russula earlei]|uniref:Uncharacterized protein n=1 Tax=Russula earlei TaxID=71964 RepID=A0ACC0U2A6_9AGAM|nr:hypothetical protein F5148DRAFT_1276849 [Russula earlei]